VDTAKRWVRTQGHSARVLFGTRRGLSQVLGRSLAALGFIATVAGIWAAITVPTKPLAHATLILAVTAGASLLFGIVTSFPRSKVSQTYTRPGMTVTVRRGDIFEQEGQLVVGFSDTFDTDTTDSVIISTRSLQGQLLERLLGGDADALDRLLVEALRGKTAESIERRDKPSGKRRRYPIGTTATIKADGRRIYCVAYTRMGNNLVVKSSVDDLWHSLGKLWDEVYAKGQHERVVVPIMGSELARIHCVDRESLIRLILLSFVARSREALLCKELVLVVHPADATKVDMLEVAAFLKTL
jgi:hypothetical protein